MSLKIIFEVPKEFENDYTFDKFADCFNRVCTDLNTFKDGVSCKYERETMDMFFNTLPKSESIDNDLSIEDISKAVDKSITKKIIKDDYCGFTSYECPCCHKEIEFSDNYCKYCGQNIKKKYN